MGIKLAFLTAILATVLVTFVSAQPEDRSRALLYQFAAKSAHPNALIEILNLLPHPMVLLKKNLQFHGFTPLREAPWGINPMTLDAFIVSPIRDERIGEYTSIYGAVVYEIDGPKTVTSFALYFSVPAAYAQYRYPWFGLEINPVAFETRMSDAFYADHKRDGGVRALNTDSHKFSYASAGNILKVDNQDYQIIAKMKMNSNATSFVIAITVQPARRKAYDGGRRRPLTSTLSVSIPTVTPSVPSVSTTGGESSSEPALSTKGPTEGDLRDSTVVSSSSYSSQELTSTTEQPIITTDQPSITTDQPTTTSEQQTTTEQPLTTATESPTTTAEQTTTTLEEATTTTEEATTTEPPTTTTKETTKTTELPTTTTESPTMTTEQPTTTTESPTTTTEQPTTTTEQPTTTTEEPTTTTKEPTKTTEQPNTTEPPTITTELPPHIITEYDYVQEYDSEAAS